MGFSKNELLEFFYCLLHYWLNLLPYREVLHDWLILLHYWKVLHYPEFITLLEQNIRIDIFQDIPLIYYGGHFENRYSNPTGHIKWILARTNDLNFFIVYYIIG